MRRLHVDQSVNERHAVGITFCSETCPQIPVTALDGSLPPWFGRVHARFLTPANSILFFGALSFVMAVFGSFLWLAASSVMTRLLLYIITCAAVPRVRARRAATGGFTLPLGNLIPVLGILSCMGLMLSSNATSMLLTAAFIVAGSLLYVIERRRRKADTPE